jgi:hypothetical protein
MADFLQADEARKALTRLPAKLPRRLFGYNQLKGFTERTRARETLRWLHALNGDPIIGKTKREFRAELGYDVEQDEGLARMKVDKKELDIDVVIEDFARHGMEMFYLEGLSDTEFTASSQLSKDARVVTRWEVTGLHAGTILGMPPTRRSLTITGMTMMTFSEERKPEGGRVMRATDEWTYWDLPGLMEQIGATA